MPIQDVLNFGIAGYSVERLISDASGLAPVPGLSPGLQACLKIWKIVDNIKIYKNRCIQLHDRCTVLLLDIRDHEVYREGSDEMKAAIDELEYSVINVAEKMERWSKYNKVKSAMKQSEIQQGLDTFAENLDRFVSKFQMSGIMGVSRAQQIADQNRQKDSSELRDFLLSIKEEIRTLMQQQPQQAAPLIESLEDAIRTDTNVNEQRDDLKDLLSDFRESELVMPPGVDLSGEVKKTSTVAITAGTHNDVYQGEWHGAKVALKYPRALGTSQSVLSSFLKDVDSWRGLRHSQIMMVYGVANIQGLVYTVSPWMENGDALQYIAKDPQVDRVKILAEVAAGLKYLHSKGVSHGDLRGANVLISIAGVACLTDYGMSTAIQKYADPAALAQTSSSQRWRAPELLATQRLDFTLESDIWSFGMTCFELIEGQVPYHTITDDALVVRAILSGGLPSRPGEETYHRGMTDQLWDLMLRCCGPQSAFRPTSEKVLEDIEHCPRPHMLASPVSEHPPQPVSAVPPQRSFSTRHRNSLDRFSPQVTPPRLSPVSPVPPTIPEEPSQNSQPSQVQQPKHPPRPLPPLPHESLSRPIQRRPHSAIAHVDHSARASHAEHRVSTLPPLGSSLPSSFPDTAFPLDKSHGSISQPLSARHGSPASSHSSLPNENRFTWGSDEVHLARRNTGSSTSMSDHHPPDLFAPRMYTLDPQDVMRDDSGKVMAGSVDALITCLVSELKDFDRGLDYQHVFFDVYPVFASHSEILTKLEEIYRDGFQGSDEIVDLQLDVLKTMCDWVPMLTLTIGESDLLQRLNQFVRSISATFDEDLRDQIKILSGHVDKQIKDILRSPTQDYFSDVPLCSLDVLTSMKVASALTKVAGDLFELIKPVHILAELDGQPQGRPYESFLNTMTGVARWVKDCIVSESELDKRRNMIGFMICIGEDCLKLRNYACAAAILITCDDVLSRLPSTKSGIEGAATKRLKDSSLALVGRTEWRPYYVELKSGSSPCIPHLRLCVRLIKREFPRHRPHTDGEGRVDFDWYRRMLKPIQDALSFQKPRHQLEIASRALAYVQTKTKSLISDANFDSKYEDRLAALVYEENNTLRETMPPLARSSTSKSGRSKVPFLKR
ncbi:hypothetical protein SISSUDRAFT_148817 [Sistotremastrum suecicum HHB10207 ss-3]|nr:hypothetical protein SISSUDRAFT_148817 [Sistotremastrum suecicum HHB10207 ss-3]